MDGFTSIVIQPDGSQAESIIREEVKGAAKALARDCFTWVPRHAFNAFLHAHILKHFEGTIHVHFGLDVKQVLLPPSDAHDTLVCATAAHVEEEHSALDGHEDHEAFVCRLLVGADGLASSVQRQLATIHPQQSWQQRHYRNPTRRNAWKVCRADA